MPHLVEVGFKRALTEDERATFPFAVPTIRTLPTLDLNVPVTLFVGENGSGKSTLLEAIATAAELPALGTSETSVDATLSAQRRLGAALRLAWRPRSRKGFFLRAEDYFGHLRAQARIEARILREKAEVRGERFDHALAASGGEHVDEALAAHHLHQYDARSHGESFLELFSSRVHPRGLYLLDEPEAPLSPKRQLELLRLIVRAAGDGAQLVIATHSPILLACPGARIWSFDEAPIRTVAYADLEHVTVMRTFLEDPAWYVRRLEEEEEERRRR